MVVITWWEWGSGEILLKVQTPSYKINKFGDLMYSMMAIANKTVSHS